MGIITVIVLFALCVLYVKVPPVKYAVKYFVYFMTVMVFSVLIAPVALFNAGDVNNTKIVSYVMGPFINALLGIRWHIRNPEGLKKDQACVVIANHQSGLDFLGMLNLWPIMEKCSAVAKSTLKYVGPFGFIAWLCGTLYIDRSNSEKAREKLNKNMEKIKEKKIKCWIFPEGTRSDSGMLPFKKGAFYLAVSQGLPIVPVVYSRYHFLDHKKWVFESGDAIISVLDPIPTADLTKDDLPQLIETTRAKMLAEHERLSKEALELPVDCVERQHKD